MLSSQSPSFAHIYRLADQYWNRVNGSFVCTTSFALVWCSVRLNVFGSVLSLSRTYISASFSGDNDWLTIHLGRRFQIAKLAAVTVWRERHVHRWTELNRTQSGLLTFSTNIRHIWITKTYYCVRTNFCTVCMHALFLYCTTNWRIFFNLL